MQEKVTLVVNYINEVKTRCTYNAAAEAIGITPQAFKKELGKPRPEASWFVSTTTSEPIGYTDEDKHPELYRITRIITSAKVLKRNLGLQYQPHSILKERPSTKRIRKFVLFIVRRLTQRYMTINQVALFIIAPIPIKNITTTEIACSNCKASCCQLEVMIISETGVPEEHIAYDQWGGETMLRLDDGWCSALDRDTFMCTIYESRPWICREFEMASYECKEQFLKK